MSWSRASSTSAPTANERFLAPMRRGLTGSRTATPAELPPVPAPAPLDLGIGGGTVVDGSGLPAFGADVAIADGRIVAVGRMGEHSRGSARGVDADGCVVAPGFIDIHTHYDAQLHFEPAASPSSWHGVTTVITGNCGFSLFPAKAIDIGWLSEMLPRVLGALA